MSRDVAEFDTSDFEPVATAVLDTSDFIPIASDDSYESQLKHLGITPERERQAKGSALRAELAFEQGDQLEKEARRQAVADYNRRQDNALSRTEAVRGVTRGTLQMGEGFSGAAETVAKLFGGPDAGETPKALGDYFAARAKAIPSAVPSLRDVGDIGSFTEYSAKALGELFPQIVTSMIPAAGAAKLGKAVGLGKKGIAALTGAGAAASSIPQEVGGIFREIRDTTGQEEPLTAIAFGTPAGLLDAITPGRLVSKVLGATSDEAKKLAWREVVRNAVKEIPKSAATEGLTEPVQEALAISAVKTADNSYDAVNEENFWRLLDAAAMGAIGGGVFGGGTTVGATALNKVSRNQEALRLKNLHRRRDARSRDARSGLVVEPTPEVPLPPEFIALQQNIDEQQRAKETAQEKPLIPAIPKTEEDAGSTATVPGLGVQAVATFKQISALKAGQKVIYATQEGGDQPATVTAKSWIKQIAQGSTSGFKVSLPILTLDISGQEVEADFGLVKLTTPVSVGTGAQAVAETTKAPKGVAPVTFLEDQSRLMPGLVWYQIQEDITSPEGGLYPKGRNITSGELLRFGYTLPERQPIGSEGTTKGGEETRQETKEVIPKQTPVVQPAAGVVIQKTELSTGSAALPPDPITIGQSIQYYSKVTNQSHRGTVTGLDGQWVSITNEDGAPVVANVANVTPVGAKNAQTAIGEQMGLVPVASGVLPLIQSLPVKEATKQTLARLSRSDLPMGVVSEISKRQLIDSGGYIVMVQDESGNVFQKQVHPKVKGIADAKEGATYIPQDKDISGVQVLLHESESIDGTVRGKRTLISLTVSEPSLGEQKLLQSIKADLISALSGRDVQMRSTTRAGHVSEHFNIDGKASEVLQVVGRVINSAKSKGGLFEGSLLQDIGGDERSVQNGVGASFAPDDALGSADLSEFINTLTKLKDDGVAVKLLDALNPRVLTLILRGKLGLTDSAEAWAKLDAKTQMSAGAVIISTYGGRKFRILVNPTLDTKGTGKTQAVAHEIGHFVWKYFLTREQQSQFNKQASLNDPIGEWVREHYPEKKWKEEYFAEAFSHFSMAKGEVVRELGNRLSPETWKLVESLSEEAFSKPDQGLRTEFDQHGKPKDDIQVVNSDSEFAPIGLLKESPATTGQLRIPAINKGTRETTDLSAFHIPLPTDVLLIDAKGNSPSPEQVRLTYRTSGKNPGLRLYVNKRPAYEIALPTGAVTKDATGISVDPAALMDTANWKRVGKTPERSPFTLERDTKKKPVAQQRAAEEATDEKGDLLPLALVPGSPVAQNYEYDETRIADTHANPPELKSPQALVDMIDADPSLVASVNSNDPSVATAATREFIKASAAKLGQLIEERQAQKLAEQVIKEIQENKDMLSVMPGARLVPTRIIASGKGAAEITALLTDPAIDPTLAANGRKLLAALPSQYTDGLTLNIVERQEQDGPKVTQSGSFAAATSIAEILQNATDENTALHEIPHWLSTFLNPIERARNNQLWRAELDRELAGATWDRRTVLQAIKDANGLTSQEYLAQSQNDTSTYHLANPDEFFAYRFTNQARAELKRDNAIDYVRNLLKRILEAVKRLVGRGDFYDAVWRKFMAGEFSVDARSGPLFERNKYGVAASLEPSVPTQVMGQTWNVQGKITAMTPEALQNSVAVAKILFEQAGFKGLDLRTFTDTRGRDLSIWHIPQDGFDMNAETRRLTELIRREVATQREPGKDPYRLAMLLNTIVEEFNDPTSLLSDPQSVDTPTRIALFRVADTERSWRGGALGGLSAFKADLARLVRNVDVELNELYYDQYGGEGIESLIDRVRTIFNGEFNEEAIREILDNQPEVEQFIDRIIAANRRDSGGRLYRKLQALLKPKAKKKLSALESDALLQEEIAKVLEIAKPLGIEPKQSPNKPLSPLQRLVLMVTPKTAAKIDGHIADAVKEGERNAGMRAALNAVSGGDAVALQEDFDAGGEPTAEMIEAGLELPEFAHWKAIRDNLLNYSPTTVKLVQDLIRGDFKGTRFGQPVARPVESKIYLNALAKSSDAEVRRLLDGYLANIEANIDITAATPETKQRVLQMIEDQTLIQLAEARQRTLDNFFNPKTSIPTTATQRLRQLLNAGVANDPRFQTDRVRQLIKRIASTYVDSDALAELATQERETKRAWMEATLAEISARENFGEPSEARDYLEAVTRTYLAERLQAAEERIVRAFLQGKDVEFERAPITPEQRERSLQEAKSKVEGLLRAGAIDTSMVEAVSRKSAIQKLTPSIPSLVQQILDTPSHRQADLRRNFATLLISELGIEPARADKMALVLEKAYGAKFKVARIAALAKARLALTPKEIEVIGVRKSIWKKIQDLVNAGGLDTSEIVEEIAKAHGGKFATPEEVTLLRNLADKSQRLSELTPEERTAVGDDPVKLHNALEDKKALHTEEIVKIHNEMSVRWARLIQPINNPITHPVMWWDTRKHTAAAINEYLAANILLKVGIATRQTSQIITQMPIYRITLALGQAWASQRQSIANGRPEGFWEDFGIALQDAFRTPLVVMKHSMSEAKAAFRGKVEARNVDRIMTGVMALERTALQAQEHHSKGNDAKSKGDYAGAASEYMQGAMLWLLGGMRLGFRALQASDAFQGTAAEYQLIARQITNGLRAMGANKADIELAKESVLGNVQKEFPAAIAYAKAAFASAGIDATDQRITRAAWNLVRSRQYQKIAELGLPADDYKAQNDYHRNVIGWNEEVTRGLGGAVATFGKKAQSTLAEAGIPTGFFAFSNAIGTSINRLFHFGPLYAMSNYGKGAPDPWWKTDTDAMQRRSEAIVGTMFYGILGSLALLGLIKVQLRPPEDKEERDLWQAQGHKAGTLEIPIGGGKFVPVSIASTALAYGAPYLAAGGAMNDLLAKRAKAQVALNEQAAKLGVPAGKVKPISAGEMMGVGAAAAKGAVLGSRTAAGLLYNVTDFGTPNVERFTAGQITPFVPGLPQLQELSRMGGVSLDSRMAGITDYLLPMPTSPARRVNLLGEPAETPDDLQRTLQVLSGGTYGIIDPSKANQHAAYRALFSSTYRPPSIDRNKGHAFPDSYRPMNGGELGRYTVARGRHFSRELSLLGTDPTEDQARAAYGRANADALREVGVNIVRPKSGRRSRTRSYRSRSRRFSIRSRNRFRIRGLGRRRNRRLLRV